MCVLAAQLRLSDAIPGLIAYLEDSRVDVREAATDALAELDAVEALPSLIKTFKAHPK